MPGTSQLGGLLQRARVSVPTAILAETTKHKGWERKWCEQNHHLCQWNLLEDGGHFAALEVPEALVADVRHFFFRVFRGAATPALPLLLAVDAKQARL